MPFGQGQGDTFNQQRFNFQLRGLDVMHPIDNLEPGFYPFVKNVRAYVDGEIRTRPGITLIKDLSGVLAVGEKVNFVHYFSDPIQAAPNYCYIIGTTTGRIIHITAAGVATVIATGFSGSRLTALASRPDRSPSPYLYLGDSLKGKKIKFDGTIQNIGIEEIPLTPDVRPSPPDALVISDFLGASPEVTNELGNHWNKSVYASTLTQINRTNTTVDKILYDGDGSGYCCVAPVLFDKSIAFHQRLSVGGEYTIVEQITNAITTTTIAGIVYDSGSTGKCTIVLTDNSDDLVPGCLIGLGAGPELVKVEAVIQGPDNKFAIKCTTTAAFLGGATVVGYKSFRCRLAGTFAAGAAVVCKAFESIITGGPTGGMWGNIRHNTAAGMRNFSTVNGRPIQNEDEITFGFYTSDPTLIRELRFWVDVDEGTTTSYSADDLSKNYYMVAFRPDDLVQFVEYDSTNTQLETTFGRVQRRALDRFNVADSARLDEIREKEELVRTNGDGQGLFGRLLKEAVFPPTAGGRDSSVTETNSGKGQWYQVRFPVSLLKSNRVGSDVSKTLKDVKSVMVNVFASDTVTVAISSMWIGGCSGPSTLALGVQRDSSAYFYCSVARNRNTGDESLPSPPTRYGVIGLRQKNVLGVKMHPDTQVTNIDHYRYGGTLPGWFMVGTTENTPGGPDVAFTDDVPDERLQFNKRLTEDNFAPFPTTDLPRRGTCNVVGSVVEFISGGGNDVANTKWSPGNDILIDGRPFLLYSSPSSTSKAELSESAGVLTAVEWEMNSPTLLASHLPILVGPYTSTGYGGVFNFAAGDSLNPGWVYWTKGNSPGTTSDKNYVELAPPGEPVIAGTIYDGRPYFWTSEKEYLIVEDGQGGFIGQEIANSKGAVSPYAVATSTLSFFLAKDGINVSEGGQPRSITDDRLYKLFPHDGQDGEDVNGIPAPDPTRYDEWQLMATGDALYFIYPTASPSTDTVWHCLRYDFGLTAWTYDMFGDGGVNTIHFAKGANVYQILMATEEGNLGRYGGDSDIDDAIQFRLWTPTFSGANERAKKRFGDLSVTLNTNDTDTIVTPYLDNYTEALDSKTVNNSVRTEEIVDLNDGDEVFGRTLGIEVVHPGENGAGSYQRLELNEWQLAWVEKPEDSIRRATDWDDCGRNGSKFVQGLHIQADTYGEDFQIRVEYDGGQLAEVLTINHTGQVEKTYSLSTPIADAHLVRIWPVDEEKRWRLFKLEWVSEPTPESAKVWETTTTDHGTCGWKHVPYGYIGYQSNTAVTLTVTNDENSETYTLPSTGGERRKTPLRLLARKGKLWKYRFEASEDFQLDWDATCVMIAPWGRGLQEGYKLDKPFGSKSRENGALI